MNWVWRRDQRVEVKKPGQVVVCAEVLVGGGMFEWRPESDWSIWEEGKKIKTY